MKTIQSLNCTELENQTIGNCIDNGISTENAIEIIEFMRLEKIEYLGNTKISLIKYIFDCIKNNQEIKYSSELLTNEKLDTIFYNGKIWQYQVFSKKYVRI
jgi:hypothetical protein